jgi:peptidoglycan glycosyltransferase
VVIAGSFADANLDPEKSYPADGPKIKIDDQVLGCRLAPPSANVTLKEALAYGCPGPVAAVAQQFSGSRLLDLFSRFRLYTPPAIIIPTTADTAVAVNPDVTLAALGQGDLRVTPLHMALAMAAVTGGGRLPAPQLVLATEDAAGEWHNVPAAESSQQAVEGSAADAAKAILAGGYEASAITSSSGKRLAWYSGFAPEVGTEYVVTVQLESGDTAEARRIGEEVLARTQGTP